MTTPALYEDFQKRVRTLDDKLGHVAVKQIFCQVILPSVYYRDMYKEMIKDEDRLPNMELVGLIKQLIYDYSWPQFLAALVYVVYIWREKESTGVNRNRFDKALEYLNKIPNTAIIRKE